jgi:hypothetical protein
VPVPSQRYGLIQAEQVIQSAPILETGVAFPVLRDTLIRLGSPPKECRPEVPSR